ncbi:hypothetical protein FRC05_004159 [Tulasnella sp. 425]|nr:hypothetical protein FRC05_004159 [Tulasnella sp. 425]
MAKNWYDPAEMAKESAIYARFVLVLAGIAAWDVLRTLPFDLSIIRGKRKWRWPMLLYFANRIFMLIHIFAYCVNLNAITEIDCDTVVWLSKITDFLGTCTSSIILALRTIAVWHRIKRVWIPLATLCVVQVVLWCLTMQYSKSVWNSQRKVCQILSTSPVPLLIGVWGFTMTLDFTIMVLCSVRLWRARTSGGISGLLLRDGMAYFLVTFIVNLVQTVLAGLSLNPIMNIIVLPMTLVVSVIASTTVFRNVFTLHDDFASEFEKSGGTSGANGATNVSRITFGKGSSKPPRFGGTGRREFLTTNQTDHFAMETVRSSPNLRGVEVTRTVDIERDADHTLYNGDHKVDVDDGSSVATRDEKGRGAF